MQEYLISLVGLKEDLNLWGSLMNPPDTTSGICGNMYHSFCNHNPPLSNIFSGIIREEIRTYVLPCLRERWVNWRLFSGDISYPVPVPVGWCNDERGMKEPENPEMSYRLHRRHHLLWHLTEGETRKDLCMYLVKTLPDTILVTAPDILHIGLEQ